MRHKMSREDQALARDFAARRYANNRSAGVSDARVGYGGDDTDPDYVGMMGEIAFGRVFGLEPDWSVEPRKGGVDYQVGGLGIDVKATHWRNGRLLATHWKTEDDTVYVLAIVNQLDVFFPGWAYACELIRPERKRELIEDKPTYAMNQAELRPMEIMAEVLNPGLLLQR